MQAPTFHLMARAMRQSYAARGAQSGAVNQHPASGIAHEGGQVRGLIGDITALHGKRQIAAGPLAHLRSGRREAASRRFSLVAAPSSMRSRRAEVARTPFWCISIMPSGSAPAGARLPVCR